MKQLKLKVKGRTAVGSSGSKALREQSKIPAVIYGKSGSYAIEIEDNDFRLLMRSAGGAAVLIEVTDEKAEKKLAIVQAVQRHPITDKFLHVDLHELSANEEMHAKMAVHVVGEAYGVKNENAVLDTPMHTIDIYCLPKNLPEYINVDVTNLKKGEAVHIKDLSKLEGVRYGGDPEAVVVMCAEPRAESEPVAVAAAPEASAAPAAAAAPAKK